MVASKNTYVPVIISAASKRNLFGNQFFADVMSERFEMSLSWMRVALNAMTGVFRRDRRGDTETQTQKRSPCEDRCRDRWYVATSPGTPGAPETRRGKKDHPHPSLCISVAPHPLDLRRLVSRAGGG